MAQPQVLQGSWEELAAHAERLKGRSDLLLIIPAGPNDEEAAPVSANEGMLAILKDIQEKHQQRPFTTDGSDTDRLSREGRARAMYGHSPIE